MRRVFADTFYYLALLNSSDDSHRQTTEFTRSFSGLITSTDWIVTELANTLSGLSTRQRVIEFVIALRADPGMRIVPASRVLLDKGWDLYHRRPDKAWSLTDCISFVVMRDEKLTDAFTLDRHFEQAGFRLIFK